MLDAPSLQGMKSKMQSAWNAGDYATFATFMEPGAEEILLSWEIEAGQRMLDVACGTGQICIPASRKGVAVTGIDFATRSIEAARSRGEREQLGVTFDVGDAEAMPYEDGSFDVVTSMVGAMFAPRAEQVASEMLRVCRSGGRIRMVNWTAEGFVGQMFQTIGQFAPPSPDIPSPMLWGDADKVRVRFGDSVDRLSITKQIYPLWDYPFGVAEVVEFFFQNYGPMQKTLASLSDHEGQKLRTELEGVFSANSIEVQNGIRLIAEFLHVDALKR
ncbi:MAG: class I SAM-dependent methyltransferase [Planctomycetota bacterium]